MIEKQKTSMEAQSSEDMQSSQAALTSLVSYDHMDLLISQHYITQVIKYNDKYD